MSTLEFFSRIRSLFHGRQKEAEIADELRFHLDAQTEQNIARGMPPEEARRQAHLDLGGLERTQEAQWSETRFIQLDHILQDVRFALRSLRKRPAFSMVVIGILALGLGANTAIFGIAKSLLLDRLPFPEPEQLVLIRQPSANTEGYTISPPDFDEYARAQKTFDHLALWVDQSVNLTGGDKPERVVGSFISANFFAMLGVRPTLGRDFVTGEDQTGAPKRVLLSYKTWQSRFGGSASAIGQNIALNGVNHEIIGVLPASFEGVLSDDDLYLPISSYPNYKQSREAAAQLAFGRIRSGVSHEQARADLDVIAQRLARDYPQYSRGIHILLSPVRDLRTENIRAMLLMLLVAVGLVMILACANVANLLLARGAERMHELSVRAAMGASRLRLMQQLITEALVIALISGTLATFLGHWMIVGLLKINPVPLPFPVHADMDAGVIAFIFALSLLTGVLFGSVPVLQLWKPELAPSLAASARTSTGSRRSQRVSAVFVASQLAICVVLVITSGLMVKTWRALLTTDPGFNTKNLLTLEYRVPRVKYTTREQQWNFHRAALAKVQQIPGVQSAALVMALPYSGNAGERKFTLPGQVVETGNEPNARANMVTPEYFSTMGITLLRGRNFNEADNVNAPLVIVIDRTMQQQYWPNEDPIGKEINLFTGESGPDGKPLPPQRASVIGIVNDTKYVEVREQHRPQLYLAYAQQSGIFASLVVRTTGDPNTYIDKVREAFWSIDKDQPMWKIRSMDALIQRMLSPERALLMLMSGFGLLAVLLAAAGTYAMMSHAVSRRTQEFGVRLALGSTRSRIMQNVLGQSGRIAAAGLVVGSVGALGATKLLRTVLFGVKETDLITFAVATVTILALALLSATIPALRASRIDPMKALRYE